MDVAHITRIRSAIRAVLEGDLGSVRVERGAFEHGVFAEMPLEKMKTATKNCRSRHWFDIELGQDALSASSHISNTAGSSVDVLNVEIVVTTHMRGTLKDCERTEVLDYVLADRLSAQHALIQPGALERTVAGFDTIIVSGLMLGPGGEGSVPILSRPIEDWANNMVRSSIVGSLILNVPHDAPAS